MYLIHCMVLKLHVESELFTTVNTVAQWSQILCGFYSYWDIQCPLWFELIVSINFLLYLKISTSLNYFFLWGYLRYDSQWFCFLVWMLKESEPEFFWACLLLPTSAVGEGLTESSLHYSNSYSDHSDLPEVPNTVGVPWKVSWLERGANKTKTVDSILAWAIHLGVGVLDSWVALPSQNILWNGKCHSVIAPRVEMLMPKGWIEMISCFKAQIPA